MPICLVASSSIPSNISSTSIQWYNSLLPNVHVSIFLSSSNNSSMVHVRSLSISVWHSVGTSEVPFFRRLVSTFMFVCQFECWYRFCFRLFFYDFVFKLLFLFYWRCRLCGCGWVSEWMSECVFFFSFFLVEIFNSLVFCCLQSCQTRRTFEYDTKFLIFALQSHSNSKYLLYTYLKRQEKKTCTNTHTDTNTKQKRTQTNIQRFTFVLEFFGLKGNINIALTLPLHHLIQLFVLTVRV